jgi:hypothetical protein
VDALRARLHTLLREPVKESLRRAIHDGWRIILSPRAGAMRATLDGLIEARWWVFGADDAADLLTAAGWREHARPLAALHAALGGALAQYLRIRVRWQQPTRFGVIEGAATPIQKAADAAKEAEKQAKAAADLEKRLEAAHAKALEDVLQDWRERRDGLEAAMGAVRDLVVALVHAEEERLRAEAGPEPTASVARTLDAMKLARIDLGHFEGFPPARFGSLLDRWRTLHARLADVGS